MASRQEHSGHIFPSVSISGESRAQLGNVYHLPPERVETPPQPFSTVPFDRDPDYVQRGPLLEEIRSKLSRPAARVALAGLGGVGKSQLAIEYAHQLRQNSPRTWTLWIYASNEARFEHSVRGLLDQLRVRGRKDPKANAFDLLRSWLQDATKGPWLVILDNADDSRVLLGSPSAPDDTAVGALHTEARLDYFPVCDHGKVLVTSRSKKTATELVYETDVIVVESMKEEQALTLLRKKLDNRYTEEHALELAQELDFMPLALVQAAAYIRQREGRCSIPQYLEKVRQYNNLEASVLDADGRDLRRDREASNSIMSTWQVSFNRIREVRPSAADLLSLMSFFDRQAIPEALLQKKDSGQKDDPGRRGKRKRMESPVVAGNGIDEDYGTSSASASSRGDADIAASNDAEFEEDLVVLRSFYLVTFTTDPKVFEMHRLVQLATKRWLKANGQLVRWGTQFITNLDEAFPTGTFENWEKCRSLFAHAAIALHTEVTGQEAVLRRASLLLNSGLYARLTGAYNDAKRMVEQSLEVRRAVLGAEHPDTLTSISNLASTYQNEGRWKEAEELGVKVIETRRTVLGAEHPHTLMSMNNLASTYQNQGRWKEAEELYMKVIETSRTVLGAEHPSTLTSMANLASTYWDQGRWKQAEELDVKVMETKRTVLGAEHPSTLMSMANLASTYQNQGRLKEAEELGVKVMETMRTVLGAEHPETLTSMNNLAHTFLQQGKLIEAEELQDQAVAGFKITLGLQHPSTCSAISTLTHIQQMRRQNSMNLTERRSPILEPEPYEQQRDQLLAQSASESCWRWIAKSCTRRRR